MVIGLQLPFSSLPLDGVPGKHVPMESETIQPLSFGELLKLKEKQLQQEQQVSASSIAAALAALQTQAVTLPLPIQGVETADPEPSVDGPAQAAVTEAGTLISSLATQSTTARITPTEFPAPVTQTRPTLEAEPGPQPIDFPEAQMVQPATVDSSKEARILTKPIALSDSAATSENHPVVDVATGQVAVHVKRSIPPTHVEQSSQQSVHTQMPQLKDSWIKPDHTYVSAQEDLIQSSDFTQSTNNTTPLPAVTSNTSDTVAGTNLTNKDQAIGRVVSNLSSTEVAPAPMVAHDGTTVISSLPVKTQTEIDEKQLSNESGNLATTYRIRSEQTRVMEEPGVLKKDAAAEARVAPERIVFPGTIRPDDAFELSLVTNESSFELSSENMEHVEVTEEAVFKPTPELTQAPDALSNSREVRSVQFLSGTTKAAQTMPDDSPVTEYQQLVSDTNISREAEVAQPSQHSFAKQVDTQIIEEPTVQQKKNALDSKVSPEKPVSVGAIHPSDISEPAKHVNMRSTEQLKENVKPDFKAAYETEAPDNAGMVSAPKPDFRVEQRVAAGSVHAAAQHNEQPLRDANTAKGLPTVHVARPNTLPSDGNQPVVNAVKTANENTLPDVEIVGVVSGSQEARTTPATNVEQEPELSRVVPTEIRSVERVQPARNTSQMTVRQTDENLGSEFRVEEPPAVAKTTVPLTYNTAADDSVIVEPVRTETTFTEGAQPKRNTPHVTVGQVGEDELSDVPVEEAPTFTKATVRSTENMTAEEPVLADPLRSEVKSQPIVHASLADAEVELNSVVAQVEQGSDAFSALTENVAPVSQPVIEVRTVEAPKTSDMKQTIETAAPKKVKDQASQVKVEHEKPVFEAQTMTSEMKAASAGTDTEAAFETSTESANKVDTKQVMPPQVEGENLQVEPKANEQKIAVETSKPKTQTVTSQETAFPQADFAIPGIGAELQAAYSDKPVVSETQLNKEILQPISNTRKAESQPVGVTPEMAVVKDRDTQNSDDKLSVQTTQLVDWTVAEKDDAFVAKFAVSRPVPVESREPLKPQHVDTPVHPEEKVVVKPIEIKPSDTADLEMQESPVHVEQVASKTVENAPGNVEVKEKMYTAQVVTIENDLEQTSGPTESAVKMGLDEKIEPKPTISMSVENAASNVELKVVEQKETQSLGQVSTFGTSEPGVNQPAVSSTKTVAEMEPKEERKLQQPVRGDEPNPTEKQTEPNQISMSMGSTSGLVNEAKAAEFNGTMPMEQIHAQAVEVVQQVVRQINSRIKNGPTSMRLQLNPQELGAIEVEMVSGSRGIQVTFFTEQASTGRLLETQLNQLRDSLVDSGVQLAGLNIGQYNTHGQKGGAFSQQPDAAPWPNEIFVEESRTMGTETSTLERRFGQSSEVDYRI